MEALTGLLLATAIAIGLTLPDQAWGQASVTVEAAESRHAGAFMVPVDKSQVLRLDVAFADLLVGNAEVADVLALTDRSIYVLGKKPGSTSLTVYGRNRPLLAVYDLGLAGAVGGLTARPLQCSPDAA